MSKQPWGSGDLRRYSAHYDVTVMNEVKEWSNACCELCDRIRASTWWRHNMEILPALMALCEGNPPVTGGFSQMWSDVELWWFIWCHPEQTFKQTIELSLIWGTIFKLLLWTSHLDWGCQIDMLRLGRTFLWMKKTFSIKCKKKIVFWFLFHCSYKLMITMPGTTKQTRGLAGFWIGLI